jgi:hypothetical protein
MLCVHKRQVRRENEFINSDARSSVSLSQTGASPGSSPPMFHAVIRSFSLLFALSLAMCGGRTAVAQSLVWNLPEDGQFVRFEGTYRVKELVGDAANSTREFEWRSELTIRSVGRETVTINGVETPCRWVEFKSVNGRESAEGTQAGPHGARIYKVLIPENRVIGKDRDSSGIPVQFLPIVRGYRKLGNREVEPVQEQVLSTFPLICLLTYYPQYKTRKSGAETILEGERKLETRTMRSVNSAKLHRDDSKPFGLSQFSVRLSLEEKGLSDPETLFKPRSETYVDLKLVETGSAATSELPDSN